MPCEVAVQLMWRGPLPEGPLHPGVKPMQQEEELGVSFRIFGRTRLTDPLVYVGQLGVPIHYRELYAQFLFPVEPRLNHVPFRGLGHVQGALFYCVPAHFLLPGNWYRGHLA